MRLDENGGQVMNIVYNSVLEGEHDLKELHFIAQETAQDCFNIIIFDGIKRFIPPLQFPTLEQAQLYFRGFSDCYHGQNRTKATLKDIIKAWLLRGQF